MAISTTTAITTSRVQSQTLSNISLLADYQIHHSDGLSADAGYQGQSQTTEQNSGQSNPESWESGYRRVPNHRPVNRELDYNERPAGINTAEYCFIQTMLQGVRLMAVRLSFLCLIRSFSLRNSLWRHANIRLQNLNTLWRSTGGKINNRVFHYGIGGEC
jgi:hypothetical protein